MIDKSCGIWLTVDTDNPDLEDIAKLQCDLEEKGIDYKGKVGIGFTRIQWVNFIRNLSRFELRFSSPLGTSRQVMGFPVRLIAPYEE